jgi:flagellar hook-associated protein 3 FlgL
MLDQRLSTSLIVGRAQDYVSAQQNRLLGLQAKLATGQNIKNTSDDVINSTRLQQLQDTLADDDQYRRNIDHMLGELNTADVTMTDMVQLAQRARELAVQAGTDTLGANNLTAMAKEVDQLLEQAIQLGNTKYNQRFLFAGFAGQTVPFARTGNNVAFNATPSTAVPGYQRPGEVATGATVPINTNGAQLLGTVTTATSGTPPVESVTGGSGFIRSLMGLKLAMEQNDKNAVRSHIGTVDTSLNEITTLQADVGARVNRLTLTKDRLDSRNVVLRSEMSGIQDVDIAKTSSELAYQQTLYQASLKINSDILKNSLLNYL